MKNKTVCFFALLVVMLVSSCSKGPAATASQALTQAAAPTASVSPTAAPIPTAAPTPTTVPLPAINFTPGSFYFNVDGKESVIFSRNVAGYMQSHYSTFISWAKFGGSSLVRIQLDSWEMGYTPAGEVDEAWAARWDKVFDTARSEGMYVLPVFSSWFDWNAGGNPYSDYSTWDSNPLNAANGGPVKSPAELFEKDSAVQKMWLKWMKTLAQRWKSRDNIIGWEIFSEVNLASGVSERSGIEFVNTAAAMIRSVDPDRPVTASIADTGEWKRFYRDADIDFIQVHPYPPFALDKFEVELIRSYMDKYKKPVLIGESGFAGSPEDYPEGNITGDKHAVWAGIVAGAMNGRALYWEDSFGMFYTKLGMSWVQKHNTLELPAAQFVKGVDFTGYAPLKTKTTKGVWGAAVGSEHSLIGWLRDAGCEPPDYKLKAVLTGQSVTITVPGSAADWRVDFYSTNDGATLLGSADVKRSGKTIKIPLPDFSDDIAFKAYAE